MWLVRVLLFLNISLKEKSELTHLGLSEHPPVRGKKMSKRLGGDHRLQIPNMLLYNSQQSNLCLWKTWYTPPDPDQGLDHNHSLYSTWEKIQRTARPSLFVDRCARLGENHALPFPWHNLTQRRFQASTCHGSRQLSGSAFDPGAAWFITAFG